MLKFTFTSKGIDTDNIYIQHQQIWEIFSASSKILYRMDDETVTVYTDKPPVVSITCKSSVLPVRRVGEKINFRFRVNVERRNAKGDRKRRGLFNFGEISVWFNDLAERNGFKIQSINQVSPPYVTFVNKPENSIPYNTVDFGGVIEVTDSGLFQKAYERGMGPGKSFGLGLLDLAA